MWAGVGDEELSPILNQFTTSILSSCVFNLFSSSAVFVSCLIFCSGFYFPLCFPKHLKHTYFVLVLIIIIPNVLTNLIVLFLFLLALLLGTFLVWLDALV